MKFINDIRREDGTIRLELLFFLLYVFFIYITKASVVPSVLGSVFLYAFVGMTIVYILITREVVFNIHNVWWMFFTLLCVVSYLVSGMKTLAALEKVIIIFVLVVALSYTIKNSFDIINITKTYCFAATSMVILLALTGELFTEDRLGTALVGNANSFTNTLIFPAIFTLWLFIREYKTKNKVLYLICLLLQLLAMALSGGRKTIIIVGAIFVYLYLRKTKEFNLKKIRNIIIIFLLISVIIYAMLEVPILYDSIGKRFFGESGGVAESDQRRFYLVELALKEWLNKPIFGHGIDMFKYYNKTATGNFYYAHNNYAEVLYDFGLVGFIIYYGFIGYIIYRVKRISTERKHMKELAFIIVLAVLLYDFGGISYYTNLNQIMICFAYIICNTESNFRLDKSDSSIGSRLCKK